LKNHYHVQAIKLEKSLKVVREKCSFFEAVPFSIASKTLTEIYD